MVVSARLATLHELETIYGAEDAALMAEVVAVDSHNARVINESER